GYLNTKSVPGDLPEAVDAIIKQAVVEVRAKGNRAVVVTGIQDVDAQKIVLAINESLNSAAFDTSAPKLTRQGNTEEVVTLINDMKSGRVGALIMSGVNPVYTLPEASGFEEALKGVNLSVTFSTKEDETSTLTQYIAAAPHYLESWGDVEIKRGYYSLTQPAIRPLFNTRQFQDALLKWIGKDITYHDYIKDTWNSVILNGSSWNKAVHDGSFRASLPAVNVNTEVITDVPAGQVEENVPTTGGGDVTDSMLSKLASNSSSSLELLLYPKVGM